MTIDATDIVYISGPMTGLPDFNRPAFDAAESLLESKGHRVFNPARHPDGYTWNTYMRLALSDLKHATAVVTLPGHQESRGARLELQIAEALNMKIAPIEAVA